MVGAAFLAMLGTVELDIEVCLLKNLLISLLEAKALGLSCGKIENDAIIRNKVTREVKLFCICKTLLYL